METEAEFWKRSHEVWQGLPPLAWTACPNNRRFVFIIRHGDPRPADPMTGRWWGPVFLEVEWAGKGVWDWRVWPSLFRGTGSCCAAGTEATCQAAQAAASRAGIERLEDLMTAARAALEICAAPAAAA